MTLRRAVAVSRNIQLHELIRNIAQDVFVADDLNEAWEILGTVTPDLVLLDHCINNRNAHDFLQRPHNNPDRVPVIVVVEENCDRNLDSELIKLGAHDCLKGSADYPRLKQIVTRIKKQQQKKSNLSDNDSIARFFAADFAAEVKMVGQSRAFKKTLSMIRLVAASRCNPVLITGQTGTGKELAAKAIHTIRHPGKKFVAINCAALTANLLESELFGHEKSAFTGADREKTGLLELAEDGTILLDEISEMPLDLQTKLLRVLQEKTFRKVGGINDIKCDATIIATSNRNLFMETKAKRFRRDLYYRLNICPVIIAPLKSPDRKDDIPLLAEYFLKTSTICPEKIEKIFALTKMALEALQKHDWPGNIRELKNVIERAILLETTDKIGLSSTIIDAHEFGEYEDDHFLEASQRIKDFSLVKAEKELIAKALQETCWQKTQAAALLGITRATLYAKVRQYDIKKNSQPITTNQNDDNYLSEHSTQPIPVTSPL
ncbi:MAG: sigma 54-interacting transcriptional regulator [Planctomycetota bacterium]